MRGHGTSGRRSISGACIRGLVSCVGKEQSSRKNIQRYGENEVVVEYVFGGGRVQMLLQFLGVLWALL